MIFLQKSKMVLFENANVRNGIKEWLECSNWKLNVISKVLKLVGVHYYQKVTLSNFITISDYSSLIATTDSGSLYQLSIKKQDAFNDESIIIVHNEGITRHYILNINVSKFPLSVYFQKACIKQEEKTISFSFSKEGVKIFFENSKKKASIYLAINFDNSTQNYLEPLVDLISLELEVFNCSTENELFSSLNSLYLLKKDYFTITSLKMY